MEITSMFWDGIKSRMKSRNENNKLLATWLDPIEYLNSADNNGRLRFTLGVPNALHQYWVIQNLQDKIYSEISEACQRPFEVEFVVTGHKTPVSPENPHALHEAMSYHEAPGKPAAATTQKDHRGYPEPLKSEWTFHTFVVGKNSEFAHAACYNVARNPGADDYNPLLIYGPVGMGKSHLLHAAGNYIREQAPHLRILYISAERFMNECIASIRHHKMDQFQQKYRESYDVLLVDDIQLLGKGESTREEFFHTLNTFIDRKKQIILASDRMPKDIMNLEDRNRTRLERGLIADITMPDLETRIAILRYKAEQFQIRLPEDAVHYIARISKRSIRELEGNLKKVKIFSELQGLQIDHDLVKKLLANHETHSAISVEDVQKLVADHFNVKISDLKSSTRAKPIVVPRQICMFLIKKFLDKSYTDIGKAFGGKDHTTVMNAIDRVKHLQATDQDIFKHVEGLETHIHNITGL
ncbi:MAG: chromosomal replication initiator protein DnaA [Bdellovibrionaceae bacterium]|nr:chromosomal replication initiator protein DnaA [Pseudobdellovibrionaceae bacterium]MBX3033656.1 chromosomal replication initiator protein DnaA [Pseudobdellovibrionaceae bacterium]